jgi:hypothetical protein
VELIRSIAVLIVLFALCVSASGQYLGFQPNMDGCLLRAEYRACQEALKYSSANITPEQRRQVEAKMKAIQADLAQVPPTRAPNAQPSRPTPSPTPYDGLEKGLQQGAQFIGTVFQIIFGLAAAALVIFIIFAVSSDARKERPFRQFAANPPLEGPMKVEITTTEVHKSIWRNQAHITLGTDWKRLTFKVRLSQRDAVALEQSNIIGYTMFTYPNPQSPEHLKDNVLYSALLHGGGYADFPTMQDLDEAKEQLMRSLQTLRTRLDQQVEHTKAMERGGSTEVHEI